MLKLSYLGVLLVIVFIGIKSGATYVAEENVSQYTNLFGDKVSFTDRNMVFMQNDALSKVSVCDLTENCIRFDETLILLPPNEVFVEARRNGFSLYKIENHRAIEVAVVYSELLILGERLDGFIVKTFEVIDGRTGDLIGIYFFSPSKGVVSFDHRYKTRSKTYDGFDISSESLVLTNSNGIFSDVVIDN